METISLNLRFQILGQIFMHSKSQIEWTDATWNPVRGRTKVDPGKHCSAERFAERFCGVPGHPFESGFDLRLVPEKLDAPLKWRSPRYDDDKRRALARFPWRRSRGTPEKIFVNSMSGDGAHRIHSWYP
jgi:protein gp37